MKISLVEIEAFRGYNEPHGFDCLADAVVLYGPNGSGKTSFFDAIAWAFFGDIRRLRGSRDVTGVSHIANQFAKGVTPAVRVHLVDDDRSAIVSRSGNQFIVIEDDVQLTGSDAKAWVARQFRSSSNTNTWTTADAERRFLSAHLLGQEQVALFLRGTNPRDRFDAVASLLGVDLVRAFYSHTEQVQKEATASLRTLEARLLALDQRLERNRVEQAELTQGISTSEVGSLDRLRSEVGDIASLAINIGAGAFRPLAEDEPVSELLSWARDLVGALRAVGEAARNRATLLIGLEPNIRQLATTDEKQVLIERELEAVRAKVGDEVAALQTIDEGLDRVRRRLSEVISALEAAKATADEFARFLLTAEPHVHSNHCPVCEREIDPDDVKGRLRERAAKVPKPVQDLEHERQSLAQEEKSLIAAASPHRVVLDSYSKRISDLEQQLAALGEVGLATRTQLEAARLTTDADPAAVLAEAETESQRAVDAEQLASRLETLVAHLGYLAAGDKRTALADAERQNRDERKTLVSDVAHARNGLTQVTRVTVAAKASELEIVERLMEEQKPVLDSLYRRLRPHPVLDRLAVDYGTYGEKGEIYFYATAGNTRANVSATFSSAQLNAVAVCIFLALNISAGTAGFAMLDDPIQNMDDFNVLGLFDLLRSVSENRQVMISTHDQQLGELLTRKLRPLQPGRKTITHEFISYDDRGPTIETRSTEYSEPPQILSRLVA
jgi:DNA repair exonuclease SbcCD ATPase subunit